MDSSERRTPDAVSRRGFLKQSAQASLAAGLFANWGCSPTGVARPKPPNVLLLSLDTTRADHMACYGYPRKTSPTLDALAENALLYTRAISTSSWTLPSHASMFTGKFVTSHGARKYEHGEMTLDAAFGTGDFFDLYRVNTIRQDELLLAEILRDAGYATGSVVAGPWLKKSFGLNRGFDYHDDDNIEGLRDDQKRLGTEVTARGLAWLDSIAGKPFFLFLNYFDPHVPYSLPENFIRRFNRTPNPGLHAQDTLIYDHEILFMDFAIRILFEQMKQMGIFDNTLIIAVGDHGELFGDHGQWGHGSFLYQGDIHVPLIVRYPVGEVAPAVRNEYIQLVDLLPLILGRLDMPIPAGVQGSPVEMISHPILAEVYPLEENSAAGHWQCLIDNRKKLLFNSKGAHKLYDLDVDPLEELDLAAENPDLLNSMIAKLLTHLGSLPRPEGSPLPVQADDATIRELEAMGYL